MTLPNFLIIGPHKAGTTSLHHYLRQHPQIFLPALKEPRFFSHNPGKPAAPSSPFSFGETRHPIRTWEQYRALFAPVTTEKAIGEASPCYLNNPYAPIRIRESLPGVRLVASLRDPVDRAYSGYLMAVRSGNETRPFMEIIQEQTAWHSILSYYQPCRRWLECFGRERMKFIRAETLRAEPASVVADISAFLDVDTAFEPDTSRRYNTGGLPRSRRLHRMLSGRHIQVLRPCVPVSLRSMLRPLKNANLRSPPRLGAEDRASIIALIRDDILRLQDLLDMDLSEWMEVEPGQAQERPAQQAAR